MSDISPVAVGSNDATAERRSWNEPADDDWYQSMDNVLGDTSDKNSFFERSNNSKSELNPDHHRSRFSAPDSAGHARSRNWSNAGARHEYSGRQQRQFGFASQYDGNFESTSQMNRRNRSRSRSPTRRSSRFEKSSSSFSSNYNNNNNNNEAFNASPSMPPRHSFATNSHQPEAFGANPLVAAAFQRLISNATLDLVAGENEMLSFKQFIAQSESNFDEHESVKQYALYKKQFKHDQLVKFFNKHKDYEWFINRYESIRRSEIMRFKQLSKFERLKVFMQLFDDLKLIENQEVCISNQAKLHEILETASVMIEGGSPQDLSNLNRFFQQAKKNQKSSEDLEPNAGYDSANLDDAGHNTVDCDNDISTPGNTFHKNTGLYIKNYPESLTKKELEEFCSKYTGFKRVYIQEPSAYYQYQSSKVWITFSVTSDINAICAEFNQHIFSNSKTILAVVCRDLVNRIRSVSGITNDPEVMAEDLKNIANLVLFYDYKWGFFQADTAGDDSVAFSEYNEAPNLNDLSYLNSKNPLLVNISELIVNQSDYYEELIDGEDNNDQSKATMQIDNNTLENELNGMHPKPSKSLDSNIGEKLKARIDPLLLYLRVVHSIDYYSGVDVVDESEHPHVISVFHTRGHLIRDYSFMQSDSKQYITMQKQRIKRLFKTRKAVIANTEHLLDPNPQLDDSTKHTHASKTNQKRTVVLDFIDLRSEEDCVNQFIQQKCEEINPQKWLCLICSKKFQDSSFLTKHINNKHSDMIDKVRQEVKLFNNYLLDSTRPSESTSGLGKVEEVQQLRSKVPKIADATQLFNTSISKLSTQPVLMATLINQIVLGESSLSLKGAQKVFSATSNQQEPRNLVSYTDVDKF